MNKEPISYYQVNIYIDGDGREIHELKALDTQHETKYAALIALPVPWGMEKGRLILSKATNPAEAFMAYDEAVANFENKMQSEMAKIQLATPPSLQELKIITP